MGIYIKRCADLGMTETLQDGEYIYALSYQQTCLCVPQKMGMQRGQAVALGELGEPVERDLMVRPCGIADMMRGGIE